MLSIENKHDSLVGICCIEYAPGLSPDSTAIYVSYREKIEADPFSADTIAAGEALSAAISSDRR